MKRWKAIEARDLARYPRYSSQASRKWLESATGDGESLFADQRLTSRYLHHLSRQVLGRNERVMEARAASIARIVELSPGQAAELQTAAKGAARHRSTKEIQNLENWVRQNTQRSKAGNLAARLKRMGTPYFGRTRERTEPGIWTASIERVLTPDQRAAWESELEAAASWSRKCQIALVISEVEKHILLAAGQRQQLRDLVGATLEQYAPDLDGMFSYQWHLQGYYCLVPCALVNDDELKAVLAEEQITIVRSRNPGHVGDTIRNLRKRHEERLRNDKS